MLVRVSGVYCSVVLCDTSNYHCIPAHESIARKRDELNWIDDAVATYEFSIEYGPYSDPPTPQLMVSPAILPDVLSQTGWELEAHFFGTGCTYATVLRPA